MMICCALRQRRAVCAAACLLGSLLVPRAVRAGGDTRMGAYELAEKLHDRKHDKTAKKYYEKALKHGDARAAEPLSRIAAAAGREHESRLLERGKSLYAAGKYREAEKVLLKAGSGGKVGAAVHFSLGDVYMALEEYGKATAQYRKAKRAY